MVKLTKAIIRKFGITKKAWAVARGSQSSRKARQKGGNKIKMARRRARRYFSRARRRGRSAFSASSVFKIIRLGALIAPGINEATYAEGWSNWDRVIGGLTIYGGWDQGHKRWSWEQLAKGWTPYLAATLATHGISKLSGMIKRL